MLCALGTLWPFRRLRSRFTVNHVEILRIAQKQRKKTTNIKRNWNTLTDGCVAWRGGDGWVLPTKKKI